MLTCPQCRKTWPEPVRQCATCQSDLSLLAEFVTGVTAGLERAEALTKAGDLGGAVREYLDVLEVDPDNAPARKHVAGWARGMRSQRVRKRRRARVKPEPPKPPPEQSPSLPAITPGGDQPAPPRPAQTTADLSRTLILGGSVILLLGLGVGFISGRMWSNQPSPSSPEPTAPAPESSDPVIRPG